MTSSASSASSVTLTWSAVEGADCYMLYARADGSSSQILVGENLTSTSYTVPKDWLESGTKYLYKVTAMKDDV